MNKFSITVELTYSKIVATLVFLGAYFMDFLNDKQGTVFMFALPFVVFLISGKQYFDTKKATND
jgi:hypothetical protein